LKLNNLLNLFRLVNDVVTSEPIVCKVATASDFSSRDYDKLAEPNVTKMSADKIKLAKPDVIKSSTDKIKLAEPAVPKIKADKIKLAEPALPSIRRDNFKLAEPVFRFTNTNTNELVKSTNKACSINPLTERCYAHENFATITTTDGLNSTNNNSTSGHFINNDPWVVVTINNDGWEINMEASNEVVDNIFEEVNEFCKQSDSQTTSHDHDSAGTNLSSLCHNPSILMTSLQTMPTPGDVDIPDLIDIGIGLMCMNRFSIETDFSKIIFFLILYLFVTF